MKKPTNTYLPVIDASVVSWDGQHGTVESSDLDAKHRRRGHWDRVWDDACDLGFWCHSPRTGQRLLFTLIDVDRDIDDESVRIWTFAACERPELTITVFND